MPLPLAPFLAASTWAAQNVMLSGQILNLALTAIQVLRAPSLWEGVETILTETEYGELTDLLDWAIDELLTPAGENMPTGTIIMWVGAINNPPSDEWLICNGQQVSRTTYADLFGVIGITYGAGDGSTTFRLPDFRGRHPLGSNPVSGGTGDFTNRPLGDYGGTEEHTLTENQIPSHTHTYTGHTNLIVVPGGSTYGNVMHAPTTKNTGSYGLGQPHNNMPPFVTINFIIKT